MDGPADLFTAQRRDDPLDLPPVAEARDIAIVAAPLGARGGLETCSVAVSLHQLGSILKREPSVNEGRVHARPITG